MGVSVTLVFLQTGWFSIGKGEEGVPMTLLMIMLVVLVQLLASVAVKI